MSNQKINAGDVVILHSHKGSSSPQKMTVANIEGDVALCYWFVSGELKKEKLNVITLTAI
ncbi:MAG TPA: hypothetical protein DEQ30_04890 [Porphyromonadaceae bacterium]|nr:hypothetical protein [Porphyromonadaceae bacterium]